MDVPGSGMCPGCSFPISGLFEPALWQDRPDGGTIPEAGTLYACRCPMCGVALLAWGPSDGSAVDGRQLQWHMHRVRTPAGRTVTEGQVTSWSRKLPGGGPAAGLITHLLVMIGTSVACVGAGASAALAAFATLLAWPLSEAAFAEAVNQGLVWGAIGALLGAVGLTRTERECLWMVALSAVIITWLVTFAGVWWDVFKSIV